MSAEPTAEQRDAAWAALHPESLPDLRHMYTADQRARVENVARALAAAVIAEREKYLRVADELQADAEEVDNLMRDPGIGTYDSIRYETKASAGYDAARRIREVTT